MTQPQTVADLRADNERLRRQLEEAEDAIRAISGGEVDAFVVATGPTPQVLTLGAADRPYRLLVEAMGQGAATLGADGTVLYANRRFAELLAMPLEKLAGSRLGTFVTPADAPRFAALLERGRIGGVHEELTLRRADGGSLPVSVAANALPEGAGGVCLVVTDLTEQKQRGEQRVQLVREQAARTDLERRVEERTAELREAQRKALQAERLAAVGQMAAGIAHESRNALQRIQACLSVLALKLQARPDELALLSRMQSAQDDLHRLYEEVREYAAPLNPRWEAWRPTELWRQAWADLTPLRDQTHAELREEPGAEDCECQGDPFYLRQVFRNVLENALTTGAASPRVTIGCTLAEVDGRPMVRIVIRDNGPGFAPEQRGRIFEPFFTTKVHGTGLGLAITKRIVEAHGGSIEAAEGPGGTIVMTLPRRSDP